MLGSNIPTTYRFPPSIWRAQGVLRPRDSHDQRLIASSITLIPNQPHAVGYTTCSGTALQCRILGYGKHLHFDTQFPLGSIAAGTPDFQDSSQISINFRSLSTSEATHLGPSGRSSFSLIKTTNSKIG